MSDAPGDSRPTNRLAAASSPYLLLHRHNPVDWYPWGDEAIERARREDKPIFLSVGYSTCYWCHVMERESFSNEEIAAAMNRWFVNVKLDREERPDLDELYMVATQLMTSQGGWPNSVFLTPDLAPFFAGTYFPPEDRWGRPGFGSLIAGIAEAWRERRADVEEQARELAHAIGHYLEHRLAPAPAPPPPEVARASFDELARRFDATWGGFGDAPKFPTPANLFLLLDEPGDEASRMLASTLDHMARGGLYDQVGGGFHRYATDREWRVPHFEKMLYDNAALLEVYARAWQRLGDPELQRVVEETVAFLDRELTSPEGAFWSAIDAETHGHEGAFYVWMREELDAALGTEDAAFLAPLYGFDRPPFFEERFYVLHLPRPLAEQAERRRTSREELLAAIAPLRERLLAARGRRQRPLTDDKVLADWNGLAIAGLAVAGAVFGRPQWLRRAERAAEHLLGAMRPGVLLHAWRGGRGEVEAFLADYAYVVHGLLELHAATGQRRWLDAAADLAAEQRRRLAHEDGGYYTAEARPDLLFRNREVFDGASSSANGVAVLGLLRLAEATGEAAWREEAERALRAFAPLVEAQPAAARTLARAVRRFHEGRAGGATYPAAGASAGAAGPAGATSAGAAGAGSAGAAEGRELGGAALAAEAEAAVRARLEVDAGETAGWRPFRLSVEVAPGWHVTGSGAPAGLVAAALEEVDCELRGVSFPPARPLASGGAAEPLPVHTGAFAVTGELRPLLRSGRPRVRLRYQACDDRRCLPPVERVVEAG